MFKVILTLLIVLSNLPSITTQCVAEYGQCGGQGYTGSTGCCSPYMCQYSNPYYSQCLTGTSSSASTASTSTASTSTGCNALYSQCGGQDWSQSTCCVNSVCTVITPYYSQCLSTSSSSTTASTSTTKASSSTTKPTTSTIKATSSTTKPTTSTIKATSSTTKPTTSTIKATSSTTKPTTSTIKATSSTTKPTTSTIKATSSTTKPTTSTIKATSSTTKPTTSTIKATSSTTKPTTSTIKATSSTTKPTTSTIKATSSTTKPTTSTTQPSTSTSKASSSTTKSATSTSSSATQGCSILYGQCGGSNWNGSTTCCSGSTCQYSNPYYSQCLPTSGASTSSGSAAIASTSSSSATTASTSSSGAVTTSTASANNDDRTPGITTRYWDCCKASCGWPGKASVTNPVQTCASDGTTPVDMNTQSGCNGGTAYMCNNQQPWNVSATLSYGYAAADIAGEGESNWCCACYSLIFTSTSIAGLELIVQVTNTGGDLGNNQFDLQMPGGGFGIFDGCVSQFPGSYNWGQQYGGVSQRSDCYNLPSVLQSGCFWRFDWFQNANNPSMLFKQVQCPQALTANTNCIRNS